MSFIVAPLMAGLTKMGSAVGGAIGGLGAGGGWQMLSLGTGLLGTAMEASGRADAARAERESAEFNAKADEQRAASERDAASAEAEDYRRRQGRIMAERRATGGASGITSAGSPLLVDESMLREIALGSSRIGHQGFVRGSRLEDSATLSRQRGAHAERAGRIGAGTTLLTGVGRAAGSAAQFWG